MSKAKILRPDADLSEVEKAMNELQRKNAELVEHEAQQNKGIAALRDMHVDEIAELEEDCKRLKSAIEAWAEEHRDDTEIFPPGKKSLALQAGTIGWRQNAPKVVLRKKVSLKEVVQRAIDNGFKKLLSTPDPVLDKNAVKDLYDDGKISDEELKALGLDIQIDETFKLELNEVESYA